MSGGIVFMVTTIRYGNTNTYLIRGSGAALLVDTDYAGTLPGFYMAIKASEIRVSDIKYVLCTHYHPDHCGIVGSLMEQGTTLIVLEPQLDYVHYSDRIFAKDPRLDHSPIDESKAKILPVAESRTFLKSIGIEGEIIQVPSHSPDSVAVILDEGICIAGDLEPYEYLAAYADNAALKADWEKVLSFDPERICYAHTNEKILRG